MEESKFLARVQPFAVLIHIITFFAIERVQFLDLPVFVVLNVAIYGYLDAMTKAPDVDF